MSWASSSIGSGSGSLITIESPLRTCSLGRQVFPLSNIWPDSISALILLREKPSVVLARKTSKRCFGSAGPTMIGSGIMAGNGGMERRKGGRVEGWKGGRVEGWKDGRMEGWKGGRMEGWKDGR